MVRHPATLFLALGLSLTAALPASAQTQGSGDVQHVAVATLEAGVLCPPKASATRPAPGTLAGETNVIEGIPTFVSQGRKVPAVIGIGFGVLAQSAGAVFDPLTIRVSHPPMGPEGVTSQSYDSAMGPDGPAITLYHLEYDYELVTGPWRITASSGATLLYDIAFEVVPPRQLPQLAQICGYGHMLSKEG